LRLTWLQRVRLKAFIAGTLWFLPAVAMIVAVPAGRLIYEIDRATRWSLLAFEPEGARAIASTMTATMLTFIVFVFSFLMLTVQFATAQLSPRIIAFAFRNRPVRASLSVFVVTLILSLVTSARIRDEWVPQLMILLTIVLGLASVILFLFVVDYFGRRLRPVVMAAYFGEAGAHVIEQVFPAHLESADAQLEPLRDDLPERGARTIAMRERSSVFLAFDAQGLASLATRANAVVELVPQVGDFVGHATALFRVYEGATPLDDEALLRSVAFGTERTLEQDPLFAYRILVDIAEKALSFAINDPTTAVLVIDQLQMLLRLTGWRRLSDGRVRDADGNVRLAYRTPEWKDFVMLAVSEIRLFGAGSPQVARRLRMMLESLIELLPEMRKPVLRLELDRLDDAVERAFADPRDRDTARIADSQGIGSPRVEP
jgi:uncharacterized membrane protein